MMINISLIDTNSKNKKKELNMEEIKKLSDEDLEKISGGTSVADIVLRLQAYETSVEDIMAAKIKIVQAYHNDDYELMFNELRDLLIAHPEIKNDLGIED